MKQVAGARMAMQTRSSTRRALANGIRNDAAAEKLARAGIDVVQDHCLLVELRRIGK